MLSTVDVGMGVTLEMEVTSKNNNPEKKIVRSVISLLWQNKGTFLQSSGAAQNVALLKLKFECLFCETLSWVGGQSSD